jgi:hypothetical protein
MVYFENSDYTEEAIEIARSILDERGLSDPSSEILQQAKNYQSQIKEAQKNKFAGKIQSRDIFRFGKLKQAFKEKDYCFIGKWLFWFIVGYGLYSGLGIGSGKGKWIELIPFAETIKSEWLFMLEVIFNIFILGIFPVIFFIMYSLKLSPKQRKERGLSLLMPKYIFFIYGISLFLFVVLVILPRL